MKEQIVKIKESASKEINEAKLLQELNDIKVKYLGKKGELTLILRGMGSLLEEERPIIRQLSKWDKRFYWRTNRDKRNSFKKRNIERKANNRKNWCNCSK